MLCILFYEVKSFTETNVIKHFHVFCTESHFPHASVPSLILSTKTYLSLSCKLGIWKIDIVWHITINFGNMTDNLDRIYMWIIMTHFTITLKLFNICYCISYFNYILQIFAVSFIFKHVLVIFLSIW